MRGARAGEWRKLLIYNLNFDYQNYKCKKVKIILLKHKWQESLIIYLGLSLALAVFFKMLLFIWNGCGMHVNEPGRY
jgi:hypothetical protein